ncbi:type II toxin-antitoxin system YhaV family toxin [Geomonas anaerohicana]|uniref:Type II toxin-antitoxin system YhaV family toxin n=1 Tax=Geomonas anaerohicana TaxID=2798583 RepID=A0ABS0YDB4_9BACT|nr:type II toxin-antitoxin system YhaV family toxin [Geomonas anaerohicana]MBJ6750290.1 type II toxin-antitoxin system YhaV family toxin [Geomonas anaerohicana]
MVSNESRIRFHAAFEQVLDELIAVVAKEKERNPQSYKDSPQAKLLARVYRAIKDEIPADPQHASFYQGEAEGHAYRQWRRAKPTKEHRLFFKWDKETNAIIYAWLNSEVSLVKYRSHMEAYRAFRGKSKG